MNISRCGPELADILVNAFARRGPRTGRLDPRTLSEHALDKQPSTTTFPLPKDDRKPNKTYPASVFGQAREEFWNTFDGKGEEVFVEGTPGLMQHLLLSTALGENAFWCTCDLAGQGCGHVCFLHFFFHGKATPELRIDVGLLRRRIETALSNGSPPLAARGLDIIPTPGTDNKCFFSALSITLFGSACWGSVLKARCAWWIRSLAPSDDILGAWAESLGNQQQEAAAVMGHLARFMSGMVEAQDVRIVLAWAFCDLWIDVTLVSNEVDFSKRSSALPSGRDTIVDLSAGHLLQDFWLLMEAESDWMANETPTFPQVLIAHQGIHFSALRWNLLCSEGLAKIVSQGTPDVRRKRKKDIAQIFL